MRLYLLILLSTLFILSCNSNRNNNVTLSKENEKLKFLQVTFLSHLHDSIAPHIVPLSNRPKPLSIPFFNGLIVDNDSLTYSNKINNLNQDSVKIPTAKNFFGKANIKNFTTDDGLALDAVGCSMVDSKGNLWFGTYGGGVSKYNGQSFNNFTTLHGLIDFIVYSIVEDNKGRIWFGTNKGVCYYDGNSITKISNYQPLKDVAVYCLLSDSKGAIWMATDGNGIVRYDGLGYTTFTSKDGLPCNDFYCLMEDRLGNIWFGSDNFGISCYNGTSFKNYNSVDGLSSNTVFSMLEDRNGKIWLATIDAGVCTFDGKVFKNYTSADGIGSDVIIKLFEDNSGIIWIGTENGGVCAYNGQFFKSFTTTNGLANNSVYSIVQDNSDNLWFSTLGGGVSRYSGDVLTTFSFEHGLVNSIIMSLVEDNYGSIWLGSDIGGVSRFDGEKFINYNSEFGFNSTVNSILLDKNNNLWFGTLGNGVKLLDGNKLISYSVEQGLASDKIFAIKEDKKGNLWFATDGGGVSKFDGKGFVNYTTDHGLASNSVWCIGEDDYGVLYFGTEDAGFSRFDGKSFVNFNTNQGLASNRVISIEKDNKGNLWFGTDAGLSGLSKDFINSLNSKGIKYVNSNFLDKGICFTNFNLQDGLPDLCVTQVLSMPNGKMAIGTNLGIAIFNPLLNKNKLDSIEIFNSKTGYPIKDVNIGCKSLFYDSNGVLWVATGSEKSAVVKFNYQDLNKLKKQPISEIKSIKVKDETICWFELFRRNNLNSAIDSSKSNFHEYLTYNVIQTDDQKNNSYNRFGNIKFDSISPFNSLPINLILPYEHNQLSFEFEAIETDKPFLVKYQYKLEGYDESWNPITSKNSATFGNMNEGNYIFKLRAQNSKGIWSEVVEYKFEVRPPFYRTWLAYLIYLILFVFSIIIYTKWRVRKFHNEKLKLQKIVQERTETVEMQKDELLKKNILIEEEKIESERQRKRSDDLLLNILPNEVAEELKRYGRAEAKQFESVTILFTDFKDFTDLASSMSPKELLSELNVYFKEFDNIITKYNIEKIKTIGDSYMCVSGLPQKNENHTTEILDAALEMQAFVNKQEIIKYHEGKKPFLMRIGIHTGPVVAGIVGIKKFSYDIWGDAVNIASRMESNSEVGKINVSVDTYTIAKEKFIFTYRGKIPIKGKQDIDMYYLVGRL